MAATSRSASAVSSVTASSGLDAVRLRADFPILQRQVHGKSLVYLDNAATSQKPRQVIDALVRYYEQSNANIHRGMHTLAEEATEQYETARSRAARFIGADGADEILFTRNTTESINLVAATWARDNVAEGDRILISNMEHHSNIVPWQWVCAERGATLDYVDARDDGTLDLDAVRIAITPRTKLVAMTHASNVLGTINPVAEIARLAHAQGAMFLVDGAQSVPHMPVDVGAIGADFLAFSSHKMVGPTGVGVLWARRETLHSMRPFLGGGEMIDQVDRQASTYNVLPWKFEAGTPNIGDVIAFGAALEYLSAVGMEAIHAHDRRLAAYALERLGEIPDVRILGPRDVAMRGGLVAFTVGDIHPHDLAQVLDYEGVAIRGGHHCCQVLMRSLGLAGSARASFYLYNLEHEVDALIAGVRKARAIFA
jgi:cysteine desulfurase/selenocysteine lyase